MQEIDVKRMYVVVPLELFQELRRRGMFGEIDQIVTKLLYKELDRRGRTSRERCENELKEMELKIRRDNPNE